MPVCRDLLSLALTKTKVSFALASRNSVLSYLPDDEDHPYSACHVIP
jgi:hypothetical protein